MRRSLAGPLAIVLAILLAGLGALIWWYTDIGTSVASRNEQIVGAQDAATQIAINSTSFNYATIDQQLSAISKQLTGPALTSFKAASPNIRTAVENSKLAITTTVNTSGIVPGATTSAVQVIIALTQNETAAGVAQSSQSIIFEETVVRVHGRWLAQELSQVGANG